MPNNIDVRSPLSVLPNITAPPGRDINFPEIFKGLTRGVISEVMVDETGLPSMLFRVVPLSGEGVPEGNNFVAVMLQPGFGNLSDTQNPPGGIIYLPPVGAHVLLLHDRQHWVIVGFYTGPFVSSLDKAVDYEGKRVSFNPGIETAQNRSVTPPGWDVPWLYGFEPGDIVLARDFNRVKVTGQGVLIASHPAGCFSMMKTNGEILERFAERDQIGLGWWQRLHYKRGTEKKAKTEEDYQKQAPKDGSFYKCDLAETTIYPLALKPYILDQRGHISRSFVDHGRSAIYSEETAQVIKDETEKKNYAVIRTAVIQPIEDQPSPSEKEKAERQASQQALEVSKDGVAYERYDYQVDANGSFRLRSGNLNKTKGGQSVAPTKQLDLSVEYASKLAALFVRIGQKGSNQTLLRMTGLNEKTAKVFLETTNVHVKARKKILAEAKQEIKLKTKNVILDCKKLKVTGKSYFNKNIYVKGKAYAKMHAKLKGSASQSSKKKSSLPFLQGLNSLTQLSNISFFAGLSGLAGMMGAGFMSSLQGLQSLQGASFMQGLQGMTALQSMQSLQGALGQGAMGFMSSMNGTLASMSAAGTLGPLGGDAMATISAMGSLGGISGGMSGFVSGDMTLLKGAGGVQFMGDLNNLLTSSQGSNGLTYMQDVVEQLDSAGLLDQTAQDGIDFLSSLSEVQEIVKNGSLQGPGGVTFLETLVNDLDSNDLLTNPELMGVQGRESMYALHATLSVMGK